MTYQHNLETDKLEISTGSKAAWNALPTEARDTIKRYCKMPLNCLSQLRVEQVAA